MFRIVPIVVALSSLAALADPVVTQLKDVHFLATGPAGLKIIGQAAKLEARTEGDQLVLSVPLENVDTGISLRNTHMREKYLDSKAHPNAELKVPLTALKAGKSQPVKGSFTVHGKTRDINFLADVTKNGDALDVSGAFDINLKQYDVEVPNYLGVTVKPDVQVAAAFSIKP